MPQPSPFQGIVPSGGMEPTFVHHDKPGGNKEILSSHIKKQSDVLKGYMNIIHSGDSLNDAEYRDYNQRLKYKDEAIKELESEDAAHATLKDRDNQLKLEHEGSETRATVQGNIGKFKNRETGTGGQ